MASSEKEMKLHYIPYIWDNDRIQVLDENKWQCFWCNKVFQVINSNKDMSQVLGTKGVHKNFIIHP